MRLGKVGGQGGTWLSNYCCSRPSLRERAFGHGSSLSESHVGGLEQVTGNLTPNSLTQRSWKMGRRAVRRRTRAVPCTSGGTGAGFAGTSLAREWQRTIHIAAFRAQNGERPIYVHLQVCPPWPGTSKVSVAWRAFRFNPAGNAYALSADPLRWHSGYFLPLPLPPPPFPPFGLPLPPPDVASSTVTATICRS